MEIFNKGLLFVFIHSNSNAKGNRIHTSAHDLMGPLTSLQVTSCSSSGLREVLQEREAKAFDK